jgi:hypothetical protein
MSSELGMAFMAREPFSAASEFDGDDIGFAVIMRAPRFAINVDTVDLDAVNCARHVAARSRGQTSTSTDAITKHTIIKANPPVNEPVR